MNHFLRLTTSAAALVVISTAFFASATVHAQEADTRQIEVLPKKKLRPVFRFEGQNAEQEAQRTPSTGAKQFRFDFNEQDKQDVAEIEPAAQPKPPKTTAKEFRFEDETERAEAPVKKLKSKPKAKITVAAAEPQVLTGRRPLRPDRKSAPKFTPQLEEENAIDVTSEATADEVTEEAKAEAIANDAVETKAADVAADVDTDNEPVIIKKIKRKKKIVYVYEDEEPSYSNVGHAGSSCGQSASY